MQFFMLSFQKEVSTNFLFFFSKNNVSALTSDTAQYHFEDIS